MRPQTLCSLSERVISRAVVHLTEWRPTFPELKGVLVPQKAVVPVVHPVKKLRAENNVAEYSLSSSRIA